MPGWNTTPAARPGSLRFAIRLAVASAAVIALAATVGDVVVEWLLPAIRAGFDVIDSQFRILVLDVTQNDNGDTAIRLRVELARTLAIQLHRFDPQPGKWLEVTTTVGTVLQPAFAVTIAALSWPAAQARELGARVLIAVVLGLMLMLIDTPIDLLAYLWDMFIYRYDPEGFYPIQYYHQFMIGGGRFAIGMAAGVVAIIGAQSVRRVEEPSAVGA